VGRLATLANAGRINTDSVETEIQRLRWLWTENSENSDSSLLLQLLGTKANDLDLFDQMQLASIIRVCQQCNTLSEAGRKLYAVSRTQRGVVNDADRLRKYLAKFDLSWEYLQT
jgi:transcriptional regulatory protein RtcR